jgi:hypothetical protein
MCRCPLNAAARAALFRIGLGLGLGLVDAGAQREKPLLVIKTRGSVDHLLLNHFMSYNLGKFLSQQVDGSLLDLPSNKLK